ncbi:hypothetical protein [Candidatus Accumulibacter sp. ACC003]|uniref:hypothetical protein n=1 Tax=Candidatus Accumulibacter sp. ACC003 TaxID=2823334 RepID=UPI0025C2293D|nr:hypothetical protein [Candidatus Accumulibacter sp. ACC003]
MHRDNVTKPAANDAQAALLRISDHTIAQPGDASRQEDDGRAAPLPGDPRGESACRNISLKTIPPSDTERSPPGTITRPRRRHCEEAKPTRQSTTTL